MSLARLTRSTMPISNCRSVNAVFDEIGALHGQPVEVEGVLGLARGVGDDGYELLHYPKAERLAGDGTPHASCLWLEFGLGSIQPNREVLARWVGKRVRIHGIAGWNEAPERAFTALSDPLAIWPAHLQVYSVQRVTSEQREA